MERIQWYTSPSVGSGSARQIIKTYLIRTRSTILHNTDVYKQQHHSIRRKSNNNKCNETSSATAAALESCNIEQNSI